jgi:hypothetical protein
MFFIINYHSIISNSLLTKINSVKINYTKMNSHCRGTNHIVSNLILYLVFNKGITFLCLIFLAEFSIQEWSNC